MEQKTFPRFFSFKEFISSYTAVLHNIVNAPDWLSIENILELALTLDEIRTEFGYPITVTSGYRCPTVNTLVGGVPNSKHTLGLAADITAKDFDALLAIIERYRVAGRFSECIVHKDKSYIHVAI